MPSGKVLPPAVCAGCGVTCGPSAGSRRRTSISGYWRRGDTEDGWQRGKRAWNATIEAEDAALTG